MARLTRKVFKLAAVVGTVPAVGIAVGYRIRAVQAAEAGSSGEKRVYRVCDLPLYPTSHEEEDLIEQRAPYPLNSIEENIGVVRRAVQGFLSPLTGTFDVVKTTTETGIEHSRATLDYIQNNPGELPRVIFIAVAGMGGIVLGYRGGVVRKLTYGSIAAVSCAALCYPKKTLELSYSSIDQVKELWKENVGEDFLEKYWPFKKDEQNEGSQVTPQSTSSNNPSTENTSQKQSKLKGDVGQSNPADKDMYSTRSS